MKIINYKTSAIIALLIFVSMSSIVTISKAQTFIEQKDMIPLRPYMNGSGMLGQELAAIDKIGTEAGKITLEEALFNKRERKAKEEYEVLKKTIHRKAEEIKEKALREARSETKEIIEAYSMVKANYLKKAESLYSEKLLAISSARQKARETH